MEEKYREQWSVHITHPRELRDMANNVTHRPDGDLYEFPDDRIRILVNGVHGIAEFILDSEEEHVYPITIGMGISPLGKITDPVQL